MPVSRAASASGVWLRALVGLAAAFVLAGCEARSAGAASALDLERTIPLAGGGRIDHLAVDPAGRRLFVAELGAGQVEAIDLASGRSLGRIGGLEEPQGLGYAPGRDELVVAAGGDGRVRFYTAGRLTIVATLKLGDDADDVRISPAGTVLVGYGHALAIIDPGGHALVRSIPLPAHPEGFEPDGDRVYVNLPNAGTIGVADLGGRADLVRWPNPGPRFNFPLALDRAGARVASVYRLPGRLVLFDARSGRVEQNLATCGDSDDAFFDPARGRIYVVCGAGVVDVFQRRGDGYAPAARITTRPGARTGLFSPELDRLYVAAPARDGKPAALLVYRPAG